MASPNSGANAPIDRSKFDFIKLRPGMSLSKLDCTDDDGKDPEGVDNFIHKEAGRHQKNNLGTTWLVYYESHLVGYITVAAGALQVERVNQSVRPKTKTDIPYYPCIVIPFFGVDKKARKRGFGTYIIKWCVGLGRVLSQRIGCRYVILNAKSAIKFYEKNRFVICEGQEKRKFKLMVRHLYFKDDPSLSSEPGTS